MYTILEHFDRLIKKKYKYAIDIDSIDSIIDKSMKNCLVKTNQVYVCTCLSIDKWR